MEDCKFAHGMKELIVMLKVKKIKRPCLNYHVIGACSYGFRCQYLHDEVILLDKENIKKFSPNELTSYLHTE